ncbi:MAG: FG-GAP-like repeat-containing protein [Gemmataceae bacterium]|nr:FG-GAP-like repeat-containing protein [Gemmataceae bacterium]
MTPSWKDFLRPRRPSARPGASRRLWLEGLEAREVPAITVTGTPTVWQSPGPVALDNPTGNIILGPSDSGRNLQVGAVESIGLDPFVPNRAVVGAVNGGLWVTDDISAPTPAYTPVGDKLPSLAIASVAFSPVVQNLVFAGTGSYTAGGLGPNFSAEAQKSGVGGAPVGIYRSTDGGRTWQLFGADVFGARAGQPGLRVRDVVPTRLNGGNTILAATADGGAGRGGIYRSDDRGATWRRLSGSDGLPDIGVTSLISDASATSNKFYAFAADPPTTAGNNPGPGAGVYVLDASNGNTRWADITSNLPTSVRSGARVVLASTAAGAGPVYAGVIADDPNFPGFGTGILQGIYRAVPFGPPESPTYVWTAVGPNGLPPDLSPGEQAQIHFALAADPTSDRFVYVGGDRAVSPVLVENRFRFPGAAARGDAIAGTWTTLTIQTDPPPAPRPGFTTPLDPGGDVEAKTAPHADFRSFVFLNPNAILAGNDGGIYRLDNPRSENALPPVWSAANGNLQITEVYQADVDNGGTPTTAGDVLLAGAQDNGESDNAAGRWVVTRGGDGTIVRADEVSQVRYYSSQNFGLVRRDGGGAPLFPAQALVGTNTTVFGVGQPFKTAFELNQADLLEPRRPNQAPPPVRILVGGDRTLYLSTDRAESFVSVAGVANNLPNPVPNINGAVTAMAFGTRQIRNAAYVATDDGNVAQSFDVTFNNGNFTLTNFSSVSAGAQATDVEMDVDNPLVAYAVSDSGVFRTTNGGTFADITGNLFSLVADGGLVKLYSLALLNNNTATTADDILFAGGHGGVYALRLSRLADGGAPVWVKLGDNIPNVLVSDLRYDPIADTLVAGTYGRGVFTLTGVSQALNNPPTVTVTGDGAGNPIAVYVDPADNTRYVVSDGVGNTRSLGIAAVRNVVLNGVGGVDTFTIGVPAGGSNGRTLPLGLAITVNGGGQAGDTLVFDAAAETDIRRLTLTPTTIGAGAGDTAFGPGGSITYTGFDAGSIQLRLGSNRSDRLVVDTSADAFGNDLAVTADGVRRVAGGTYLFSGVEYLTLSGGAAGDSFRIGPTVFGVDVIGRGGDDLVVVGGDGGLFAATGPISVFGGDGNDTLQVGGTAGDDRVTARLLNAAGAVALDGLPTPVSTVNTEAVNFDGKAGTNSYTFADTSDTVFGSSTAPLNGLVVAPSGLGAGTVRIGSVVRLGVAGLTGGLTINGDPDGNGDRDALTVLGTSAAGRVSGFGEAVFGDGRDRVTVSDTAVGVGSVGTAGDLLTVNIGPAEGDRSVSFLYVATGNESGGVGDRITATPSARLPILVDGMGPSGNPGDQLTVLGDGTFVSAPTTDPALGGPNTQITLTADQSSVGVVRVEGTSLPGGGVSSGAVAVGTGAGPEAVVRVFDRLGGAQRFEVIPFPGFAGGVSVATGDVTGDGIADLLVGAGPGGGPRVAVFNGLDASRVYDFFGYEDSFRGGVNVSAGDFNGDGVGDIVLGTGVGGGPRVRVLSGRDLSPIRDVFAYNRDFRGGVNVSVGDVTADGTPDLVTSTGIGGGPRVVVLDGRNLSQIASFFVFDPTSRAGFTAAAGDVNGDGFADIVVGSGSGDPARVRVLSGLNRAPLADFTLPDLPAQAGARVAAGDVNGDGIADILAAGGPGSAPVVREYQVTAVDPTTSALSPRFGEIRRFSAFDDGFGFGVFLGASD